MGYTFRYLSCSYTSLYVNIWIPFSILVLFQSLWLQQNMMWKRGGFLRFYLFIYLFTYYSSWALWNIHNHGKTSSVIGGGGMGKEAFWSILIPQDGKKYPKKCKSNWGVGGLLFPPCMPPLLLWRFLKPQVAKKVDVTLSRGLLMGHSPRPMEARKRSGAAVVCHCCHTVV